MLKKIGRNDPCWCGSGKKYKKCHEAFDEKMELEKQEKKGRTARLKSPDSYPAGYGLQITIQTHFNHRFLP